MSRLGTTRPFRDDSGNVVPGSVSEVHWLRLGKLDQWVMIRGRDRKLPPLVLLHGGPGMPETPLFRRFNSALECSWMNRNGLTKRCAARAAAGSRMPPCRSGNTLATGSCLRSLTAESRLGMAWDKDEIEP